MNLKPYYHNDQITIYHGDAFEIIPQLPAPDLVLTDPPYSFEARGGGFFGDTQHDGTRDYIKELDEIDCCDFDGRRLLNSWPEFPPTLVVFTNKTILVEYLRFAQNQQLAFDVHVMIKDNPIPTKKHHFLPDLEYIVVMRKPGAFFNSDSIYQDYRKHYAITRKPNEFHPAQKPIRLMARYIRVLLPDDGVVCDPFMGSGTTLVAAKMLRRQAIGIDFNEQCCEMAVKRLSQEVLEF